MDFIKANRMNEINEINEIINTTPTHHTYVGLQCMLDNPEFLASYFFDDISVQSSTTVIYAYTKH